MSANDNGDQGAAQPAGVGGLAELVAGINWPGAVALLGLLALFAVGPRLGVDPEKAAAGVAAAFAAYTLTHARAANRQTNGSLTARMDAAVSRGTADLRAELPALIRQALDTTSARSPWAELEGGASDQPDTRPGGYAGG